MTGIFRFRDFKLFLLARFCMVLAIYIQATIVGWQMYDLTGNALDLGLVGLFEAVPSILVALYAGHLADIRERRSIILICLVVLFLCSLALLLFTGSWNFFLQEYGAYPIFFVIFLSGIARGFISPAIFGFVTQIVPREHYPHSAAWLGTSFQAGAVLGPALGGILYGQIGIQAAYLSDCFFIGLPLFLLLWIPKKPLPTKPSPEPLRESLLVGVRFVKGQKLMLGAMSLDMFAVLFGGATALLPIFAKDILQVGSEGLGTLRSATSLGALGMAYLLTWFPPLQASGKKLLISVLGFGVCMVVFGLSTSFWLSFVALFCSGAFDSVSVVVRSTIMQTMTPDSTRGRVSSINKIFIGSSNEIGAFESGLTANWFGPVGSVVFGGVMTGVVVLSTLVFVPELKKLELKDWT